MIITIDGTVGTGKSTIAKLLAQKLGFIHFDTGAMYRCLSFGILKHGIDLNNSAQLKSFLDSFDFDIKVIEGQKHYFYEGEDVSTDIRQELVSKLASTHSAHPEVRKKLVEVQRGQGVKINGVFEGRDMGTVVFPEATLKVFLTGSPEVRAQRRYHELLQKFPEQNKNLTLEEVLQQLHERDERDTGRAHSPLRPAQDALIVDTSNLSIEQVLEIIFNKFQQTTN